MKGKCFCGAVEFEVSGDPAAAGYCHCDDCAAWAGAPINAFTLFPKGRVTVTKGDDNVGTYNKTENSYRKFCMTCGGHLFTDHPGMKMIDVYHNVVPGMGHEPALHVFYSMKSISMKDGLPKFKDMPADFGGSGDTLPD
ncbi:MAG: GFA family protein [Alphaproteobacteria bacterium]|nr:GFA family protein [Alphaproteobacteria bacterium]